MNCSHITLLFNVQRQDVVNFFGHELGSIDHHLDSNLFSSADPTTAADFSKETYRFLAHLDLASLLPFVGIAIEPPDRTCLVHYNSMILLVVQGDKTSAFSTSDLEPQIIAEAIATFQHNNRNRADLDLPQLDTMTIPCITMVGTRPFFYQIPVTQQLSDCVATGQFPPQPTVVRRCVPPARRKASEGMEVPGYRRIALQYYDAFRGVAKDY